MFGYRWQRGHDSEDRIYRDGKISLYFTMGDINHCEPWSPAAAEFEFGCADAESDSVFNLVGLMGGAFRA